MPNIRIQGVVEKRQGIYYQVDADAQPIGTGGMGQVFKGLRVEERTGVTRPVAIKFMYSDLPPQAVERARREAAIQLRNDNLVEMLGFIETDEVTSTGEVIKHYHVVSELLTGVSLSDVLEGRTKDRDGNDVPFAVKMLQDYRNDSPRFARTIVMGVLSGLMALHDAGYIHRDIDPSNIMLTADGHIKLIDFGIAKQMNNLTTNDKSLTVAGAFMGKPEYAAPELALGDIKHQNQTTDIYAVGVLLYQCIVGHTPFEGARHVILERQIKGKLPLNVIKNRELRKIICKACEKRQESRYQSAAQMRVALELIDDSKRASSFKNNNYYIVGAVAVALSIIGGGAFVHHWMEELEEEKEREHALAIQQEKDNKARTQVYALLEKATAAATSGSDYNKEYYEKDLMQAFLLYDEAESVARQIDLSLSDSIALLKADVVIGLDSAACHYLRKQNEAVVEGLQDSTYYRERRDSVVTFMNEYIL